MALWNELKRRNVVKVAGAYAVVAWLLVQIIVEVEEPLQLPNWVDTLVIVLLLIGFPIAVVLAWAFDLTPSGIVVTPAAKDADLKTASNGKKRPVESAQGAPERSIALLPFENLSASDEDAHFSIGIHGEVINQLAKIKALRVIARTSVLQYSNTATPIAEIANALNVQTVMEGTVQHSGGRVRLTAQLIDATTDTHLWADSYDREIDDVFEIQSEIATRIAKALTLELSVAEQRSIDDKPTNSVEAYELFLRAMVMYREGDSGGPTAPAGKRITLQSTLDKAIELDSEFATAHAWKAWIYTFSRAYDPVDENDWLEKSRSLDQLVREHAGKALALNPDIGLARAALAKVDLYNREIVDAKTGFEKALQSSPNDAEVLRWTANFHWFVERHEIAIRYAKGALELDPVNTAYFDLLGRVYHSSGDYDLAISTLRQSIDINPGMPMDYVSLARSELAAGNSSNALSAIEKAAQLMPDDSSPGLWADLAYGYGRLGRPEDAVKMFDRIQELAVRRYVDPAVWAFAYLAVGNREQAMSNLARVNDDARLVSNPFTVMFIRQNAWSDSALEHKEFTELRTALGFRN